MFLGGMKMAFTVFMTAKTACRFHASFFRNLGSAGCNPIFLENFEFSRLNPNFFRKFEFSRLNSLFLQKLSSAG